MGVQSQKRATNSRAIRRRPEHQYKSSTAHSRKKADDEDRPFDPARDCPVCKREAAGKSQPHRKHHDLCPCSRSNRKNQKVCTKYMKKLTDVFASNQQRQSPLKQKEAVQQQAMYTFFVPSPDRKRKASDNDSKPKAKKLKPPPQGQMNLQPPPPPQNGGSTNDPIVLDDADMVPVQGAPEMDESEMNRNLSVDQMEVNETESPPTGPPLVASNVAAGVTDTTLPPMAMPTGSLLTIVEGSLSGDGSKKKKGIPEPISIVAEFISKMSKEDLDLWFPPHSLKFVIPNDRSYGRPLNPLYHSVEGTSLYHVHWEAHFPNIKILCPDPTCDGGMLKQDRTNYSKNKTLMPLFNMSGPPSWCIVMSYVCQTCGKRYNGNDGRVLLTLPEYVRNAYPVEPKYAGAGNCHLDLDCCHVVQENMVTYGNGEQLARLIASRGSKDYLRRFAEYVSFMSHYNAHSDNPVTPAEYPSFEEFMPTMPPAGDTIRDLFDEACASNLTPYRVSDHDRCVREMQSVGTNAFFAQDHTMEMVKNYTKKLGAAAAWDTATETGEIASVVLTGGTGVADIAHAAEQLARRPHFNPVAMYSDTYPAKDAFWKILFGAVLTGRLGLYHFQQRIIKTLRQGHIDYHRALRELCHCIYEWEPETYQALVQALRAGNMGRDKKPLSDQDILDIEMSKDFRKKYGKFLMKKIRPPDVIRQKLEEWFCNYKVDSSDPIERPGRGRPDPITGKKLFTVDTKTALEEQKKNAAHIQDIVPVQDMYRVIPPTKTTRHGLAEYSLLRCESKLEGFHDHLAHFGNVGMRSSLCDNVNLLGTTMYNTRIRHRLRMAATPVDERPNVPAYWANNPTFYNHSELGYINDLAKESGYPTIPFEYARELPEDNGERFFSEYWIQERARQAAFQSSPLNDRCYCDQCGNNPVPLVHDKKKSPLLPNKNGPSSKEADSVWSSPLIATPVKSKNEETPSSVDVVTKAVFDSSKKASPSSSSKKASSTPSCDDSSPTLVDLSPVPLSPQKLSPVKASPDIPGWSNQLYCVPAQMEGSHPPFLVPRGGYPMFGGPAPQYPQAQGWGWGNIAETARPKAQHQVCCQPFLQWACRPNRNGRPPHDKSCPKSSKAKK